MKWLIGVSLIALAITSVPAQKADNSIDFKCNQNCDTMFRTLCEKAVAECQNDVTGEICTRWNERESTWRKHGHAHPEVQARANRDDAAAD